MNVLIIGCGNIGRIFLKGLLNSGVASQEEITLTDINPETLSNIKYMYPEVKIASKPVPSAQCVVLSVKPQEFLVSESISGHQPGYFYCPDACIISVMAGVSMETISQKTHSRRIIRSMPNAPAEYGFGMTCYTATKEVSKSELMEAEKIFHAMGTSVYLDNEELLNVVTAVSGTGPAYYFWFARVLIKAATELGFDEATARMLVRQTMLGAFHQMNASGKNPDELIQMVASRGGTTEAAMKVFTEEKLEETLLRAVHAAASRSRGLAKGIEE